MATARRVFSASLTISPGVHGVSLFYCRVLREPRPTSDFPTTHQSLLTLGEQALAQQTESGVQAIKKQRDIGNEKKGTDGR
jgi:hypothetical protein